MQTTKVSIVVPAYNVQEYLRECLDSILSQTYKNLQVICVDDGSTDNTGAILDEYAVGDTRLSVLHQSNGGVSAARNKGLDNAKGEYVLFLDADDYLEGDAIERALAGAKATNAQMITFGATVFPLENATYRLNELISPRLVHFPQFDPSLLFDEKSTPFAWRTLIARDLLKESRIRFDEQLKFGEDLLFQFALYIRARGVLLMPDKLINYRVGRDGSAMGVLVKDAVTLVDAHLYVAEQIVKDWQDNGLIEPYGNRLLPWLAEYVAVDIIRLEGPNRPRCRAIMRMIVEHAFSEQQREEACNHGLFGNALALLLSKDEPSPRDYERASKLFTLRFAVHSLVRGEAIARLRGRNPQK